MSILSYKRVSTDRQDLGLDAQQARIDAWLHGRAVDAAFTDDGVSGAIPLEERPYGARLLERAECGDVIVVAKLDRLFRSVSDAALTLDSWNRKCIVMVSIQEGFDMTTAFGRAMAQIASVFAELERAMIRERTKAALAVKKANGEKLGGLPPFGWNAKRGSLIENPVEQDALEYMRLWRDNGSSFREIASKLDAQGIKPKGRRGRWCYSSVQGILERRRS